MKRTILIFVLIFQLIQTNAQTKVIAHRGFSAKAPENTLSAFKKAIDSGAGYFELDVHASKDDSLMVIHDKTVDRTSSNEMKGKVEKMTYKELKSVKAGYSNHFGDTFKDEKIPTLSEALRTARGKIRVCVEIKVQGVEKEILNTIHTLGMQDQVIIFSFNYNILRKIREIDPDIPILLLSVKGNKRTIRRAEALNAGAIGLGPAPLLTQKYVDSAHGSGLEVWRWTVNDPKEMQRMIDLGVDGLITNFPDKALELVGQEKK